jgi:large repetitive protein
METAVVNGDGSITFTPNTGYSGTTTYTYQVCDPGGLCATATVTITVQEQTQTNQAPVANDDHGGSIEQDGADGTVNILANDTDPDGNPTPTSGHTVDMDPITPGIQSTFTNTFVDNTVWTYNTATGVVTCNPAAGFSGTTVTIYTLCDAGGLCDNATITFVVTPVAGNNPPVANNDNASTSFETPVTTNVLANDSDPDGDPLTVTIVSQSPNGIAVVNGNGTITFTPNAGFSGTTTYTYQICDNGTPPLCATATVTVTVGSAGGNNAPIANDDTGSGVENGVNVSISILLNDLDPDGNPTTFSGHTVDIDITEPGIQTTYISTSPAVTWSYNTQFGTLSCDPGQDVNGVLTLIYELCDNGTPSLCDQATVTVTITPSTGSINENTITYLVYPNPSSTNLTIKSNEVIKNIHVYSLEGKELFSSIQSTINVESLTSGMYYMSIEFENGSSSRTNFIKE